MNKLHQAYIDLGLSPGAALDDVLERWRTVARMWHPDRAGTADEKRIAESELKKVNGARDLLVRHFQTGEHRSQHCECQLPQPAPSYSAPPPPPSSPPPSQPKATTTPRPRTRRPEPSAKPGVMWLVTAGMIFVGWTLVHMNSKISIQEKSDVPPAYQRIYMPIATGNAQPVFNLRGTPKSSSDTVGADLPVRPQHSPAKPETPPPPKPKSPTITFVSSDGRLISLDDNTTWELYSTEAADSFFHWQPGDKITIKGQNSTPLWLVNETRAYQAVKVLPVR